MAASCKGYCGDYKHRKPFYYGSRYLQGVKRCQICEIFLVWDGIYCPCCGMKLRQRSRVPKTRAKQLEVAGVKRL